MKPLKHFLPILCIMIGCSNFAQVSKQKTVEQSSKTKNSLSECITLEEMLKQIEARDKRFEAKNNETNSEVDVVLNEDYNNLLTLELASRISGFDASKATKMHTMKGMLAETLSYYWENGREVVKEKSPTNRKRETYPRSDLVQIKWVDGEADMGSFLDFIDLEKYPEKTKVNGVGESAYWNPIKNHLELCYNGVSFTLQVDISNDENLNKEKTIALARLIIEEQIK